MQMLNDYTEENNNQFWQHIKSYNYKQSQYKIQQQYKICQSNEF